MGAKKLAFTKNRPKKVDAFCSRCGRRMVIHRHQEGQICGEFCPGTMRFRQSREADRIAKAKRELEELANGGRP